MLLCSIICYPLGYILLKTIDKIKIVSFEQLVYSVYTVQAQFGTLIFGALIICYFYLDYKDKNIMFYKTLNINSLKYYTIKIIVINIIFFIGVFISSLTLCLIYNKLEFLSIIIIKSEAVLVYYSILIATLGFLFKNFILAFFTNFLVWIIGIFISASSSNLRFFAYYDASNPDYIGYGKFLEGQININQLCVIIGENYIFNFILLFICLVIIGINKRRWVINGI